MQFFPRGKPATKDNGLSYQGPRTASGFLGYIKQFIASDKSVGRVEAMDAIAKKFGGAAQQLLATLSLRHLGAGPACPIAALAAALCCSCRRQGAGMPRPSRAGVALSLRCAPSVATAAQLLPMGWALSRTKPCFLNACTAAASCLQARPARSWLRRRRPRLPT